MKKVSVFITVFLLCIYNAFAATQKTCPAGLFCPDNGKYTPGDTYSHDIQGYQIAPSELVAPGWGPWSEEGLCDKYKNDGTPYSGCIYTATDYDEVWASMWFGFYTIKNGEVTHHSSKTNAITNVFACPGTHPSSDSGASSVFQCYRVNSNGQKEYYKAPTDETPEYDGNYDTDSVNAILTNLQLALEQAQTAARNLQNVLKESNTGIKVNLPRRTDGNTEIVVQSVDNVSVQENNLSTLDVKHVGTKIEPNLTNAIKKVDMADIKTPEPQIEPNSTNDNQTVESEALASTSSGRAAMPVGRTITRSAINKEIKATSARSATNKDKRKTSVARSGDNSRQNIAETRKKRAGLSRDVVTNNR